MARHTSYLYTSEGEHLVKTVRVDEPQDEALDGLETPDEAEVADAEVPPQTGDAPPVDDDA